VIARRSVDELSHDVHMTGVANGVLDHMNEHPAHGNGVSEPGCAGGVQVDLVDYLVGRGARTFVIRQDFGARLVRLRAHIGFRIALVEWNRMALAPKWLAEPAVLDARQMFHQAEEVRTRWNHRSAQLFVVETIELPQHDIAMAVEAGAQTLFLVTGERHSHAQILVPRPASIRFSERL
jgi:hypothetical protein